VNRRFALVALWAVFAAASVGVGFGAAGLVGTPFTDTGSTGSSPSAIDVLSSAPAITATADATTPSGDSASPGETSKSASPRSAGASRATSAPGSRAAGTKSSSPRSTRTRSSGGGGSGGSKGGGAALTRGSVDTAGGYVSGTCQSGLISLSASPAVGWQLDDVSAGRRVEGEAKFEQSGDGDGKVQVTAWCASGKPRFSVESDGGGGGDDGGGGGDGDNSGPGGGGGD
jgi:hypothetical protein